MKTVLLFSLILFGFGSTHAAEPKRFDDYPTCSRIRYLAVEKPETPFSVMDQTYENIARYEAALVNRAIAAYRYDGCKEPQQMRDLLEPVSHCDWAGPYLTAESALPKWILMGALSPRVLEQYRKMEPENFQAFRVCYWSH